MKITHYEDGALTPRAQAVMRYEMRNRGKQIYKEVKRKQRMSEIKEAITRFAITLALMALPVIAYLLTTA